MNSFLASLALLSVAAIADAAAMGCPANSSADRAWLDKQLAPECRAAALLAQLHGVDEKIAVLDTGGLKRYGLEDPPGSDGPAGPTHVPGVASLPNGLTLAASFDPELAERYGAAVGTEFRAAGMRQMYGPTLDIARTWHSGRVPEAFGEDPELSARMATWVVRGVQSQGVAATLKHFAVYAQEQGRTGAMPFGRRPAVNNIVSERTIREIYLPAFRAAVEEGGALGVMCAFPRVNGVYTCENPTLLGILKSEWHFRGTVAPDFPDAQRSVVAAVNAGLDTGRFGQAAPAAAAGAPAAAASLGHKTSERQAPEHQTSKTGKEPPPPTDKPPPPPTEPGAALGAALGMEPIPGGVSLHAAVMSHEVSLERLDDMVRRRLMVRFAAEAVESESVRSGAELGVRVAEAGAVLLKNESGLLPLSGAVKSIAVFGAQAGASPQVATPGSAYVEPSRATAAIDSIKSRAGSAVHVTYFGGSLGLDALAPIPVELLHTGDGAEGAVGLRVEYYANAGMKFTGNPLATQVVTGPAVKDAAPIQGLPANNAWSARWSGTLTARYTGTHYFTLSGAGSGRLYVGDRMVAHFDRVDFGAVAHAAVKLEKGRAVAIRVEFTPGEAAPLPGMRMMGTTLGTLLQVGWAEPDDRIERARAAAKAADVAIVFLADRHGEGADRTDLSLPPDQDELVAAVAAANPRTIVVLSTAGPISMPWQRHVGAILETWYAGDSFAEAATRLLFGDASPGGRLPVTFPQSELQGLAVAERNYPGMTAADGSLDEVHFDEGLLVGYRWFDANGSVPLYPFGYGLTYSWLRIDHVELETSGVEPRVKATVTNLGSRADSEVVEVYLGFPAGAGEPPKRLVAFRSVALAAGASRDVELALSARSFEVWDESAHRWRTPGGRYEVMVGRSSRDIVFQRSVVRP